MATQGPNGWIDRFRHPLTDGVEFLPKVPGIYAIYDRSRRKFYVGAARDSIYKRGLDHRRAFRARNHPNPRMNRIVKEGHALDFFIFVLQKFPNDGDVMWKYRLNLLELIWAIELRAVDEEGGYNQEAGHVRTPSWRLRECELRLGPNRFAYLPGVHPQDAIRTVLVDSWVRGLPP